jgi:hypothetical protein
VSHISPNSLHYRVRKLVEMDPTMKTLDLYERLRPEFPRENPTWLRNAIQKVRSATRRRLKNK